jgi:hypothetical protein
MVPNERRILCHRNQSTRGGLLGPVGEEPEEIEAACTVEHVFMAIKRRSLGGPKSATAGR